MQGRRKPQDGIFYPEDLKELAIRFKAGASPGETEHDRENRAIRLLELGQKRKPLALSFVLKVRQHPLDRD
jgi:hypothetical protein